MLGTLKRHRERQGLSLTDVANRSGMDRAAISRLENGVYLNSTVDTLYRYAQAVGASASAFCKVCLWGHSGVRRGHSGVRAHLAIRRIPLLTNLTVYWS